MLRLHWALLVQSCPSVSQSLSLLALYNETLMLSSCFLSMPFSMELSEEEAGVAAAVISVAASGVILMTRRISSFA